MTIPETELKVVGDRSRWKTGPAIAVWVAASLFAVVGFAAVLAAARALGLQDDELNRHDTVLVAPRPIAIAAATLVAYVALSYLAGFYVRAALPKIGGRWLKLSACGALFAAALGYWNASRLAADIREIGMKAVFDAPRLDPAILVGLASAAAIGIAQAIALIPSGRRFVWWPFAAVAAAGVASTIGASTRGILPHAIAIVLGAAGAGVVLGAAFVVLARSPDRR